MALWQDNALVLERSQVMDRGHAEALMPMIEEAMEDAGVSPSQVDLLAVTTGPGGFTGVRIGLAAARGLALALDRPLIGLSVFDVLLHQMTRDIKAEQRASRQILCVIDTKRQDVFLQRFDHNLQPVNHATVADCEQVIGILAAGSGGVSQLAERYILLGDGCEVIRHAWTGDQQAWQDLDVMVYNTQPRASQVAEMAAAQGVPEPGAALPKPLYLRSPEVRINPDGGRLRP